MLSKANTENIICTTNAKHCVSSVSDSDKCDIVTEFPVFACHPRRCSILSRLSPSQHDACRNVSLFVTVRRWNNPIQRILSILKQSLRHSIGHNLPFPDLPAWPGRWGTLKCAEQKIGCQHMQPFMSTCQTSSNMQGINSKCRHNIWTAQGGGGSFQP